MKNLLKQNVSTVKHAVEVKPSKAGVEMMQQT